MSDLDYYNERLQKRMMEEGLVDTPSFQDGVGSLKESALNPPPASDVEVIPTAPVEVSSEMAQEMRGDGNRYWGNAADDGILMSVAKGVFNGAAKAGDSLNALIVDGLNLPIKGYEKISGQSVDFRFRRTEAPLDLAATDTLGNVTTGIAQFGIGFYTGGNVARAAGWLRTGKKLHDFGRGASIGAFADFTAFAGDEERLSNILTQVDSPILNNAVTRYLAAGEDDGPWEGRLKNVLEGGILGVAGEAILPAIRGIKKAKSALAQGDKKAAEDIMTAAREETANILEAKKDVIAAEAGEVGEQFDFFAEAASRTNRAANVADTTWTPQAVEEVSAAVRAFSHAAPETQVESAASVLASKIKVDTLNTEADVRATMDALASVKLPEFNTWTHAQQKRAAQARGMDLATLQNYYKIGAVNEHVLLSSEVLLKKQAERVTDLISKNIDNNQIAAEVAQYQELLNMFASFKNISGRTLDANRIKLSLKRGNVEEAQRFMTDRFGSDKNFNKFKEAWMTSKGDLGELASLNRTPVHKIISDSALELWKNGLLSGVRTMTVNGLGNVTNLYKEIGVRFFQGVNGAARTALRGIEPGQERVYMGEALAMTMAQVDSFVETLHTAARVTRSGDFLKSFNVPRVDGIDKAELGYTRKISADYWGIGTQPGSLARFVEKMSGIPGMQTQAAMRMAVDKAGSVINVPGNLMNMMDGWSRNQASRSQKYALAYRQLMSEGASSGDAFTRMRQIMDSPAFEDSIQEQLEDFAARVTFQEQLGPNGQKVLQLVKGVRPLQIPVLEYVMPFVRTPINIFKQGVTEINPAIAPLSQDFRDGLRAGGIQADEAMGRLAFGSALATTAIMGAVNGNITGAGPTDPNMRRTLMRTGWRPYSIRVEDGINPDGSPKYSYIGYGRIEPAAWVMGSMATAVETAHYSGLINDRKETDFGDYAAAMMSALTEATMDKSFFVGAQNFVLAAHDPQRYLPALGSRYAGSMVPTIARDMEIMLQKTPYLRDVRSAEDAIKNRMIGMSGEVAVTRNRWGDPIAMDEGWFLGARSYFSPIGMSDKYSEAIDNEIRRLAIDGVMDTDGQMKNYPDAMINMPQRSMVRSGVSIKFDTHQYSRLVEIAGKEIKLDPLGIGQEMTMKEALNHLVTKDEVYKTAHPLRQARLIKMVSKNYDKLARNQLMEEYPELRNKLEEAHRLDIMSKTGVATAEDQFKLLEDLSD